MEDTQDFKVTQAGEMLPAKPKTAVEIIKGVMEIAINNRVLIDEKKEKISGAIAQTRKAITVIETPAHDEFINKLIVKANNTVSEMEALRKAYTGKVNAWLKEEIKPENDLKLEIAPLVEMRNARAKKLADANAIKEAAIARERDKKLHEAEVKGKMKVSFETNIIDKVTEYGRSIEKYFMDYLKVDNKVEFRKKLEGIKPVLKEDFFLSLFQVDYDPNRMTPAEFDALVKRAKTFWVYEDINAKYIDSCKEIIGQWIAKIDSRVKELEILAQGGKEAERMAKITAEREAVRIAEEKADAELKKLKAQQAAAEQVASESHTAEFNAQAQTQTIIQPAGTRNKDYYVLDNPGDTAEVGKIIGSIIMHALPNYSLEDRIKLVIQHGADGKPKKDADGNVEYTPGVQFWLDFAATLKYKVDLKGLTRKTRITAVNKKK